ncbi:O-antigen translocase [Photobacterium phosphoreum]|uniref:O-antigen translocase n=1 Tax=Photobacterium phosphoreum TaxID=659 RepID=UPI0039AFCCA3
MKLSKVIIWNGLSVAVKMLSLMGINKVLAYYTGPSSFAYISQLQNITNMALVLPVNSISTATVKYASDNENIDKNSLIKTCFTMMLFCCFIVFLSFNFFSREISLYTFKTIDYEYIFNIYSVSIFFFAINSFCLNLMNGLREIKKYIISNILGNIFSFFLFLILIVNMNYQGALICIVSSQIINATISVFVLKKYIRIRFRELVGKVSLEDFIQVIKFSSMAVFAGFILPISLSIIRNIIIDNDGIVVAGIWDATWKISSIYLMFISTTLSVYYLPVFSREKSKVKLRNEVVKGCVIVFLLTAFCGVAIFYLKDHLISILFSKDFHMVSELIGYQLFGDSIKMISWVLGYFLISKACVKYYILTESFQWLSFILITYLSITKYGIVGVQYAYIFSQLVYLIVIIFCVRFLFNKEASFE